MSESKPKKTGRPPIKADWPAIREWCEAGHTYQGAAFQFGVNVSTIRNRAKRERWETPSRTKAELACVQKVIYGLQETSGDPEEEGPVAKPEGEKHEALVAALCHRGLELFSEAAPVPRTWKEADLLDRMARRALRLEDREQRRADSLFVDVAILNQGPIEHSPTALEVEEEGLEEPPARHEARSIECEANGEG